MIVEDEMDLSQAPQRGNVRNGHSRAAVDHTASAPTALGGFAKHASALVANGYSPEPNVLPSPIGAELVMDLSVMTRSRTLLADFPPPA
jgi:hypothetical protein